MSLCWYRRWWSFWYKGNIFWINWLEIDDQKGRFGGFGCSLYFYVSKRLHEIFLSTLPSTIRRHMPNSFSSFVADVVILGIMRRYVWEVSSNYNRWYTYLALLNCLSWLSGLGRIDCLRYWPLQNCLRDGVALELAFATTARHCCSLCSLWDFTWGYSVWSSWLQRSCRKYKYVWKSLF